jgi:hypothetical protein
VPSAGSEPVIPAIRRPQTYTLDRRATGISSLLGMFAKFQKVAIIVIMPIRTEQLSLHWTDFHEISYLNIFRKSIENIHVS